MMTQSSNAVTAASEIRRVPRRGMVLAASTLGFGVIRLDVSALNVAAKPIETALGGGVGGVQSVVDACTLVFAALILSAGIAAETLTASRHTGNDMANGRSTNNPD